jgi:hypothetical protein
MASPSTVITLGYGSFGSVNLVPTLGYGVLSIQGFGRIEYTMPRSQLGYTLERSQLDYTLANQRLEYTGEVP